MFIGLTGTNCSGKSIAAQYLKQKGFIVFSLSDIIREEAASRKQELTVNNLINLGNELRQTHGSDILAKRVIEKLVDKTKFETLNNLTNDYTKASPLRAQVSKSKGVIESIRNPAEVISLRQGLQTNLTQKDVLRIFYLIAIDAPQELRYQRFISRKRVEGEQLTFEQFKETDDRNLGKGQEESGQQLAKVIQMSDHIIINDTENLLELYQKVDQALLKAKQYRKDIYYMQYARIASSRSDCCKRMVGAVVVSNERDRIIATGFNGVPSGIKNCNEGGCTRCNDATIPSGTKLDECICVHAEENALLHLADSDIGKQGATIYTTIFPCLYCTKSICQKDIKRIVFVGDYPSDPRVVSLLKEKNIDIHRLNL